MGLNLGLNIGAMEAEAEPAAPKASAPTPQATEAAQVAVEEQAPEPDLITAEETSPAIPATLQEVLDQHLLWLQSRGRMGQQANLSRGIFGGADLTDCNLRDAILHKTVLKGSDLLLTDFQGASLMQADLQGANLLGAKFQDANLQGAILEEASGLQGEQLAGANLFGAALPAQLSLGKGLQDLRVLAKVSGWLVMVMAAISLLSFLRVVTTSDVQLLTNGPVVPLVGLQNLLPLVPFYLCGPVVMLGLYICFHVYLQRLWDGAATQPAIFPDGRRLDTRLPWFARWPARGRMKWLREHNPSLASLEGWISILLLYWMVPATAFVFWARYLTLQDLRGTLLHSAVVVAGGLAAQYFTQAAGRAYRNSAPPPPQQGRSVWIRGSVAPAIGLTLVLLSFGAVRGIPHDNPRAPEASWAVQSWASDLLWWAGYTPTAQFAELDVSTKPPDWTGREEDLARVEGARLNGLRLRYIQAYGAFFAKAHLWQADLTRADLSGADLREANLRQANLQFAGLDRAKLSRAMLQEAVLQEANLTQASLQDADLSRASLAGALLLDAKLDGANLYAADLSSAVLQRASLQHADLRDARLENADLSMAILRQAYLSSAKMAGARLPAAQLAQAFLTQADLRKADLRGAGLQGAILNGADLAGANLEQADLRGALGLTSAQICSAASARQVLLDEPLQLETESRCGLNR
jgi:uncharacterized protein YjbI with pentapeptide repeats